MPGKTNLSNSDNRELLIIVVEKIEKIEIDVGILKKAKEDETKLKIKEAEVKGAETQKVKTLERIVWPSLGVAIAANIKAWFFPS